MKLLTSIIVIVLVIGAGLYFLKKEVNKPVAQDTSSDTNSDIINNTDNSSDDTKSMDTNKKMLENFTPITKVDSLQKIDTKVGTGKEVMAGATVSVHYTGAVASTGVVFQSSKDFGTNPVTFPLDQVIKGWTDGIPGMKVGGTRRLVIPADQAYGSNPPPGSGIPANADLVFDVELVSVQ